MSFPLTVRAGAESDLTESRDWYESQREGLGQEFLAAVDQMFDRLREAPRLYAAGYRGVRRAGLRRFPYVVYYRLRNEEVFVIAVMLGSRDPRLWRSRV